MALAQKEEGTALTAAVSDTLLPTVHRLHNRKEEKDMQQEKEDSAKEEKEDSKEKLPAKAAKQGLPVDAGTAAATIMPQAAQRRAKEKVVDLEWWARARTTGLRIGIKDGTQAPPMLHRRARQRASP